VIGVIAALFGFYTPFPIPSKLLVFHLLGKTGAITGIELISAAAIFGAVVGPFVFGRLGDLLGRKRIYGLEMVILAVGAVLSALSWSFAALVIFRFILGLGIGGDYPMSATIMSEYSNVKSRGKLVGTVFAMQGFGILTGIVLAIGLLATIPAQLSLIWRILLAAGAIPAISVYYYRRKMPETPRYTLTVEGNVKETKKVIEHLTGSTPSSESASVTGRKRYSEMLRYYLPIIIGTAVSWFLFDISFYGTSIYTPTLFTALSLTYAPHLSHISHLLIAEEYTAVVDLIFTIPGYWIAVALIDWAGRKTLQLAGFAAMAVLFAVLGLVPGIISLGLPFVVIYGLTFLFGNIGPNTTTFIIPTELFPTAFRASGHGIAAGSGKLGAALSTLFFATIILAIGDAGMMLFLSFVAVLGVIFTAVFIRETKGLTLEASSEEKKLVAKSAE
jgi:PHS family inorganic phosphate transporter-like MFS transporter